MNNRMRIIWVKMGGLWPINSGGRLRSYHIIEALSQSHDVTVVTTHAPGESAAELRQRLPLCRRVISIPFSPPKRNTLRFFVSLLFSWLTRLPVDIFKHQCSQLRRIVEDQLVTEKYDICIADFLTVFPNIPTTGNTPVVLFSHNVEYMIWRRLSDNEWFWPVRLILSIESFKMRKYEARACQWSAATISVSEEDVVRLKHDSPQACIASIPTGVDINFFMPDSTQKKTSASLVFSGSMDWQPNEDAMMYFLREIFPLIKRQIPSVSLSVVGRNPTPRVRAEAANHGVEVTGTVPDIRPWLKTAMVYVVPLRIGGGTRLKIYEALSMGMPVVSTTVGAEGLDLTEGVHLLRADNAAAFAEQTIRLIGDAQLRESLGKAGRALMEENYAWSQVAHRFEMLCREAMSAQHVTVDMQSTSAGRT
jgi:polysaccharide biosynthesis protein PslH